MSKNNKVKKIKVCKRVNMPETNSSSSHCLTIFKGTGIDDSLREILKEEDGKRILVIPGEGEFGRGDEDYNDTKSKLQYATYQILDPEFSDRKAMFEKVVKDFLGVDEIVYNWYDEWEVDKWMEQNPHSTFSECPLVYNESGARLDSENTVDHESVDLIEEQIFETEDTLRDFLFSPNSWLFCGECNVTEPKEKFPKLAEEDPGLYLSLIPDNFMLYGNESVDIEILKDFPYSFNTPKLEKIHRERDNNERKNWILAPVTWGGGFWGGGDDAIDEDPTTIILSNIWAERIEGQFYLRIGPVPSSTTDLNVYVPYITQDLFKYPFTMNFYNRRVFDNWDPWAEFCNNNCDSIPVPSSEPVFKINLHPSFNKFKLHDYVV